MTTLENKRLLLVDDDSLVRQSMADYLEDCGATVLQAENGEIGLEMARRERPDLVLLDLRMPVMDGLEVMTVLHREASDLPVILVSGVGTMNDVIAALRLGAWDYVTKPIANMEMLEMTASRVFERADLIDENRRYRVQREALATPHDIASETAGKRSEDALARIKRVLLETVDALGHAIEKDVPYAGSHQRRTAKLAVAIARKMNMDAERLEGLCLAALIHNLGEIAVPVEILGKPGALEADEFDQIQAHSEVGYGILKNVSFPWPVARIVLEHHERMDGSGYPFGHKGAELLLESRVLAVADSVAAMTSRRPYRSARDLNAALSEVHRADDRRYDPGVVAACDALIREDGFQFDGPWEWGTTSAATPA